MQNWELYRIWRSQTGTNTNLLIHYFYFINFRSSSDILDYHLFFRGKIKLFILIPSFIIIAAPRYENCNPSVYLKHITQIIHCLLLSQWLIIFCNSYTDCIWMIRSIYAPIIIIIMIVSYKKVFCYSFYSYVLNFFCCNSSLTK